MEEGGLFLDFDVRLADGTLSPLASAGYNLLTQQFGVSIDDITSSFGPILLDLGCFMLFPTLLAVKFGHRIVYLGPVSLFRWFTGTDEESCSLAATTIEQIFLGPLIYSYVIERLSWRWGFWFVSIALGICTVLVFFFVPETTYQRTFVTPTNDGSSSSKDDDSAKGDLESEEKVDSERQSAVSVYQKRSYLSSLKVWNGTFDNMFKIFLRPFPFLFSPVGLTNLSGLVGITLGIAITGPLLDSGAVWLSRRNRGIYEPEFRLKFMSAMLMTILPLITEWKYLLRMLNFSMVVSGTTAVVYLLDTHGANALQIFALSNFLKNMVLYGSTFFANGMVQNTGVTVSLFILAGCQGVCWLASIPMFIFGKRERSYTYLCSSSR
ncbi:hypothetical protein EUX98_g821 [Antrodiella citrinella]|uniref:Major facilitator superfamily (MFS) profile domain-containing protein n=1 Tax=Antrodiella citrinella TaxID=2447956 RepID=A0A4S4N2Y8_9APHY|nr:hypothetical protein EUX98_g821 [Antrodiella citrinella]